MGNWNKERAKKRSDDTIDSLPIKDIEIKGYVRDMDLMGLDTVCSDLNRPGCQKVHVVRSIVLQDERIARLIFDKRSGPDEIFGGFVVVPNSLSMRTGCANTRRSSTL